MKLKRWQALSLAAAIVIVPIVSCSQRSLVLVTVNAPQGVGYTDVTLIITANSVERTTFSKASFTGGVYKAGVYLPSDMSGPVSFFAEVVEDGCQIATSDHVDSPDVSPGATVSLTIGLEAQACVPVDGGAGGSGTGGGTGSGGSGTGGLRGTGGVTTGTAGATGSGGAVGGGGAAGSGGVIGSGGVVGAGGVIGSGGHGGSATGGAFGSGGVIGTGGLIGTGGVVGSGGGGGKGGSSATGGTIGTGGGVGSGGTSGCTCPGRNEICQPGTTTCICSQSDSTACAGVTCGTVTNICNETVQCPNNCPSGYFCDTSLNTCRKLVVTGCGGSVSTGAGLVVGTAAAPICPL